MRWLLLVLLSTPFSWVNSQDTQLDTAKNPFRFFEEQNYTYENYTVVTEDGYELLLVRLPYDRGVISSDFTRPPILFVHGLIASMADFLAAGPGVAFPYIALEEGYDVFLLNTRGNRWSRKHRTLAPDTDDEYWDFSFHEVGYYDLTATIDFIINITDYSQVSYVGHSQGTTVFLAMASTRPEYNDKIKLSILLGPVAFVGNAQYLNIIDDVIDDLGVNEVLAYNSIISNEENVLCSASPLQNLSCNQFYEFFGPSTQTNYSLLSAYLVNYPAGASRRQLVHFLQNAYSGEFLQFNFGEEENLVRYRQVMPPEYNLIAITAPTVLYYGANDSFADVEDVAKLVVGLPNVVADILIPYVATNHLDLLIGTQTQALVTEPALVLLNEYNNP